jgi:hypothetical protein
MLPWHEHGSLLQVQSDTARLLSRTVAKIFYCCGRRRENRFAGQPHLPTGWIASEVFHGNVLSHCQTQSTGMADLNKNYEKEAFDT